MSARLNPTVAFALAAIARLEARRVGFYRFDAWIDLDVARWLEFIAETLKRTP